MLRAVALSALYGLASASELTCKVQPTAENPVCEIEIVLTERLAKTATFAPGGRDFPVEFNPDGTMSFRKNAWYHDESVAWSVSGLNKTLLNGDLSSATHNVVYGDGNPDLEVILVNGEFPGPTIRVPEGALMAITVRNNMMERSTLMHVHGMRQKNTWYYDGTAYTQCPIVPGNSFTYRFKAEPAGVHWYHAHYAAQRKDGFVGGFIVERDEAMTVKPTAILMHEISEVSSSAYITNEYFKNQNGAGSANVVNSKHYKHDGQEINAAVYDTTAINGRGRNKQFESNSLVPREVFTSGFTADKLASGSRMRLALINGGTGFGHEVSVDGHHLKVLESDGMKLEPTVVKAVQVFTGETFMVELIPTSEAESLALGGNPFALRVSTLSEYYWENKADPLAKPTGNATERSKHYHALSDEVKIAKSAYGLIVYGEATEAVMQKAKSTWNPTWADRDTQCTDATPCKVLNCEHDTFGKSRPHVSCLHISELNADSADVSKLLDNSLPLYNDTKMLGVGFWTGAHVNGQRWKSYGLTPLSAPNPQYTNCTARPSFNKCHRWENWPLNHRIRVVLSVENEPSPQGLGDPHVVHFHGYKVRVLAQGFHTQNEDGFAVEANQELERVMMMQAEANYPVEVGRKITADSEVHNRVNLNGPLKDTIAIQGGGWAYVEIHTDNPGFWMYHCHMAQHSQDGMAMLIKIGDKMPPAPADWPTCNNFKPDVTKAAFDTVLNKPSQEFPFEAPKPSALGSLEAVKVLSDDGKFYSYSKPDYCATHKAGATKEPMTWSKCDADVAGEFEIVNNLDGKTVSIKSKRYADRCWSIVQRRKILAGSRVYLKRCKGTENEAFVIKDGGIWFSKTGPKGQEFCVPFQADFNLKLKRCFAHGGLVGRIRDEL